jgi:HEAT repeat protein
VIPILIELLNKSNANTIGPNGAIWSLCQFGARAKPAVPALLELLNDERESVRSDATNALIQIDPEAAAKAGIK